MKNIVNTSEYLYTLINNYTPFNEQEEKDKAVMLEFTNSCDDVLTRNNHFGHFSASALVVNEDFTKTLLVHHNVYNGYVLPGGHADGESDFLSVAIREVKEETGIEVKPYSNEIFSIFSAPVAIETDDKRGFCYVAIHEIDDGTILLAYCAGGEEDGCTLNRLRIRKIKIKA